MCHSDSRSGLIGDDDEVNESRLVQSLPAAEVQRVIDGIQAKRREEVAKSATWGPRGKAGSQTGSNFRASTSL